MANEKMNPRSPEEIARAAQKAALEQMRAMMGHIPGMPDMQAQIMAQMQAAVPDLAEIQAQQAAMETLGGVDAATVAETARRNMAQAAATAQALQDGNLLNHCARRMPLPSTGWARRTAGRYAAPRSVG